MRGSLFVKCPTCGGNCVLPAQEVLDNIYYMYIACRYCPPDPFLNKSAPFHEHIGSDDGRCKKCGKRHLDLVMGHVLTILKQKEIYPDDAALKDVGTPLIAYGYQIPYPPRLGSKSLVLIMDSVTRDSADKIIAQVPEIKGVIKRSGSQSQSVGILDTDSKPHTYELLSGCDMRCDVISSLFGELTIYRNQSLIHIEFNNNKIKSLEEMYLKGEFDNAKVFDGFCGPGTLGLFSILAGAKKVILNDAWLPAIDNVILNILVNSELLGVRLYFQLQDINKRDRIGDEPELMAKASGMAGIEVYHGDIRKTAKILKECDICLIDTFPSVDPYEYITIFKDIAKKVAVI
ncbi:MAG: methyltransferase [Candidatus Methanoperedens sp.]|nr:methyltransferase [Candidatus Methanoperedens sp.]MCE8424654.1 methyltransferase [Candidatus Methanoperedens sp.]